MKIYITSAKSQCSVLIELQSQIVPLSSFYFPETIKISVFLKDMEIMKTSWNIKRKIDYKVCTIDHRNPDKALVNKSQCFVILWNKS